MTRVKVCGITRTEDALHAASVGADYVGLVLAPSPRRCSLPDAKRIAAELAQAYPGVGRVAVFADPEEEEIERAVDAIDLTHVQIHGRCPSRLPVRVDWIAALGVTGPGEVVLPPGRPWAILAEPKVEGLMGGTGRTFPWEWVEPLNRAHRLFVAGGLDAERVAVLLERFEPYGVDASSRLEERVGIKDKARVRSFVEAVRSHPSKRGAD